MHIKIIRRPLGEAPDWVRDAWIGTSLPLAVEGRRVWRSLGVLTGPASWFLQIWAIVSGKGIKVAGYAVNAKVAVDRLEETKPEAASWWREQAPGLLDGSRMFVFDADACEPQQPAE